MIYLNCPVKWTEKQKPRISHFNGLLTRQSGNAKMTRATNIRRCLLIYNLKFYVLVMLCVVLASSNVFSQTPDSLSLQKSLYPNTSGKDYSFDAPWRVKSISTPIPFMLEIKDADENTLDTLKRWSMSYKNQSGQYVNFYDHDFGSIQITTGYFNYFTSFAATQLGFGVGDTIKVLCDMTYNDGSGDQHFKKHLRIVVGSELPNIVDKWYYGDVHYHTSFTDNPYEYGGNFAMIQKAAKAMGLDWTITTDHASNKSCYPLPCPVGKLVDDLDTGDWDDLVDSIEMYSDNDFQLIIGEEITCNNGVQWIDAKSIHLLAFGLSDFVAGPIGLLPEGDPNTLRTLNDVMAEVSLKGGITYAAHPADISDVWLNPYLWIQPWSYDNYSTALSYSNFKGLEAWNTRIKGEKNISYYDQNPFEWDYGDKVDEAYLNRQTGIRTWDSLLVSRLAISSGTPRKILLTAGSDAHGDFNYNVSGLPILGYTATDDAYGKVRTAIYSEGGMGSGGANVLEALREGKSVVTDGPLVIFGIDRDGNGTIGPGDLKIGDQDTINISGPARVIVQWASTNDFGPVEDIGVWIGHPLLENGKRILKYNSWVSSLTGDYDFPLTTELQPLGVTGWCYLRAEGNTLNRKYECFTNPIWIYVRGSGQDVIPPQVAGVSWTSDISTNILVQFSENMNQGTLNSTNITVIGSQTGSHSCSFSFNPGSFIFTINPNSNFAYNELVTLNISTGVEDLAGNHIASMYSQSFYIQGALSYLIAPWAGSNGEISPDTEIYVSQGGNAMFSAIPDGGYQVDCWYLDGNVSQMGGNSYTISNIQWSHSIGVTFKPGGQIALTAPNGGEVFAHYTDMPITWITSGPIGNYVKLELILNGAPERIIDPSVFNDGSYVWDVPWDTPVNSHYKVKVSSVNSPSTSDLSDGEFQIVNEITVPPIIPINTIQDLQAIGSDVAHPSDGHYLLMKDIIAWGFAFHPIGTGSANYFEGNLDGNGFVIKGLTIEQSSSEYVGLFSVIRSNGVVRDLTIADFFVEGLQYVGTFAGQNDGTIINCKATNDDALPYYGTSGVSGTGTGGHVGGIAGWNRGIVRGCQVIRSNNNDVEISANGPLVGGITGLNHGTDNYNPIIEFCLSNCFVESKGSSAGEAGGIAGENSKTIRECGSFSRLSGRYNWVGGIVGNSLGGYITNCFFTGEVISGKWTGGIAGYLYGATIDSCYGGFGSGGSNKGGLTGRNEGTILNSFWDTETTGLANATYDGGGTIVNTHGETTTEMYKQATFVTKYGTNWDFTNTWAIDENVDYPRLRGLGDVLSPPEGLVATIGTGDGVHLSWNLVTYYLAGTTLEAFYKVYRSDDASEDSPKTELTGWQASRTFVDSTAVPEETYYYWVKAAATTTGARESQFSDSALGQRTYPPMGTPTGVTASDGMPNSVLIEWNLVADANYYRVYRSKPVGGTKTAICNWQTGVSYRDTPVYTDTTYYYWVVAASDSTGWRASGYGGPDSGHYSIQDQIAPTISISMTPNNPIETQAVSLLVSAGDNVQLKKSTLHWNEGSDHTWIWENINAQTCSLSHGIGAFPAGDTITYWAEVWDNSDNRAESEHRKIVVQSELVSVPSQPQGPICRRANQLGQYETGGSVSNLSSPVEYRFDWGDSISTWGNSITSKIWMIDGIYLVKAQARSQVNHNRVSGWSGSLPVIIDSRSPIVFIATNGGADTLVYDSIMTISGLSGDIEPSSGLATTQINASVPNNGDKHNWSFTVILNQGTNELVITSTDNSGNAGSDTVRVNVSSDVYDGTSPAIPNAFSLSQNYPNPFNPTTVIQFNLPKRSHVSIEIYNLLGQEVIKVVDQIFPAGSHQVNWDGSIANGSQAASGIYFYRFKTEEYVETKKMLLLK